MQIYINLYNTHTYKTSLIYINSLIPCTIENLYQLEMETPKPFWWHRLKLKKNIPQLKWGWSQKRKLYSSSTEAECINIRQRQEKCSACWKELEFIWKILIREQIQCFSRLQLQFWNFLASAIPNIALKTSSFSIISLCWKLTTNTYSKATEHLGIEPNSQHFTKSPQIPLSFPLAFSVSVG